VIGNGIGGLTCAGLLARTGKKVVVLEQRGRLGGCAHAYHHKGYEYDIGRNLTQYWQQSFKHKSTVNLVNNYHLIIFERL